MPYNLRRLFVMILIYCHPSNVRALWETLEEMMSEDLKKSSSVVADIRTRVLHSILESMSNDITNYHLIKYKVTSD